MTSASRESQCKPLIDNTYHESFGDPGAGPTPPPCTVGGAELFDDDKALRRAMSGAAGKVFKALYDGHAEKVRNKKNGSIKYANPDGTIDESRVDFAICKRLAEAGCGEEQTERLYLQSRQYLDKKDRQEKWDRKTGDTTYGKGTIRKAMAAAEKTGGDKKSSPTATPEDGKNHIRQKVAAIREMPGKEHDRILLIAETIEGGLKSGGAFYHDGYDSYFLDSHDSSLKLIHSDCEDTRSLLFDCGVNAAENSLYKYVAEHLRQKAKKHGTKADVHLFTHYDRATHKLYWSNFDGCMFRVDSSVRETVWNGTDGVLFLNLLKGDPVTIRPVDPSIDYIMQYLVEPVSFSDQGPLTVDELRRLFWMYIRALPFRSLFKTVPIVAFIGDPGGTKTSSLRRVGVSFFGGGYDVTVLMENQDDFDVVAGQSFFLVLDNVESRLRWLENRLATMATGGKTRKRTLYTNKSVTEIAQEAWTVYTSRKQTCNNRPDVADRTFIFITKRLKKFKDEIQIIDDVVRARDEIVSYILIKCKDTIEALEAADASGIDYSSTFRLADFASFCQKVADHEGFGPEMRRIFEKMTYAQSDFVFSDDPLLTLLYEWVQDNEGLEVGSADLHAALSALAEKNGVFWPYENSLSLGARLSRVVNNLELFFRVEHRVDKHGKTNKYTFWLMK
jgi:hypothetical protein